MLNIVLTPSCSRGVQLCRVWPRGEELRAGRAGSQRTCSLEAERRGSQEWRTQEHSLQGPLSVLGCGWRRQSSRMGMDCVPSSSKGPVISLHPQAPSKHQDPPMTRGLIFKQNSAQHPHSSHSSLKWFPLPAWSPGCWPLRTSAARSQTPLPICIPAHPGLSAPAGVGAP